jgi:hypothetical protein
MVVLTILGNPEKTANSMDRIYPTLTTARSLPEEGGHMAKI